MQMTGRIRWSEVFERGASAQEKKQGYGRLSLAGFQNSFRRVQPFDAQRCVLPNSLKETGVIRYEQSTKMSGGTSDRNVFCGNTGGRWKLWDYLPFSPKL